MMRVAIAISDFLLFMTFHRGHNASFPIEIVEFLSDECFSFDKKCATMQQTNCKLLA